MDVQDNKAVETSKDDSPVGDQPGRTHSGWREQARIRRERWIRETINDQPKSKWTLPELMAWAGTRRLRWVRAMDGIDDICGSMDLWLSDDAADDIMAAHDDVYTDIKDHLYELGLSSDQSRPDLVSKEDCAHLMVCIDKCDRPCLADKCGPVVHSGWRFECEKGLQRYRDVFGELEDNAAEQRADEIETDQPHSPVVKPDKNNRGRSRHAGYEQAMKAGTKWLVENGCPKEDDRENLAQLKFEMETECCKSVESPPSSKSLDRWAKEAIKKQRLDLSKMS